MPKSVKGGSLQDRKTMKGGPFGDIDKKLPKKVSRSRKRPAQKNFGHGRDSNPSLFLADLKKSSKQLEAEEATLVWQLQGSQLIKLIKSVTSLVLKKEKKKSLSYSLRFSTKRRQFRLDQRT